MEGGSTLGVRDQAAYLRVDLCEGDGGAGLPVDEAPQPGLALDDAVGDPHLPAQGGQEDHQLEDSVSSECSLTRSDDLKVSWAAIAQG